MKDDLILDYISDSIRNAGYDPYSQLLGYLSTRNITYITRQGAARNLIKNVDNTDIEAFIKTIDHNHNPTCDTSVPQVSLYK